MGWGCALTDYLQERSLEFQREKEEKRLLEGRIAMLTGQMIGRGRRADAGGDGAVRTPARLQTGPKPVSRIYLGYSMQSIGYGFHNRV